MTEICDCALCRADRDHPARHLHDGFRRIAQCMSRADLAACLLQYAARSEMGDTDEAILRQIGGLAPGDLDAARAAVARDEADLRRALEEAPAAIADLAGTVEARDWLTDVAEAVAFSRPGFHLHPKQIAITLHGRSYRIDMPPDWMAYANFFEVFLRRNYAHAIRPVDTIFDIGAFVGLSAIYLNSLYPDAEIVAVEPNPANLKALDRTLGLNGAEIRYRAIGKLLAAESGEAEIANLAADAGATSMMNSTVIALADAPKLRVGAITLGDLLGDAAGRGGRYGIKLDIEGGEFALRAAAPLLADAEWILGEFHYGPWTTPGDRWLHDRLDADFTLELQPPRLEMTGRGEFFCIAQDFRAVKPAPQTAAVPTTTIQTTTTQTTTTQTTTTQTAAVLTTTTQTTAAPHTGSREQ